ncbi:Trypsin [Corynebacterium uterequi]|uniref:Trypsin n=1 Tax=Corynebacterium uterequi TaxID=1072256 RepID=A0A0G3HDZ3_9CORY|nr:Trypsin [Corynebacterium uterequi]
MPANSPWIPGTIITLTEEYPVPGIAFDKTTCTVAFTFTDAAGQGYAVTASHCGHVDELVWPADARTEFDFSYEAGRVIYSGLDDPGADGYAADVGIIKLTDAGSYMAPASGALGETLLHEGPGEAGLCKVGATTGWTCGEAGMREQPYRMTHPGTGQELLSRGDTALLCAQTGDSGGPVVGTLDDRQVVVGLVSGITAGGTCTGDDPAGIQVAYVPMAVILDTIREVVPDAQLVPTAPSH